MPKCIALLVKILKGLKYKKADEFKEKATKEVEEYHKAAEIIKKEKLFILRTLIITFFQLNFMHSVSFFIYKYHQIDYE